MNKRPNNLESYLTHILQGVVNSPSELNIRPVEDDSKITYQVWTKADEVGQIIGMRGQLANSVRLLIKAWARAHHMRKKVYLEVLENPPDDIG